MCTQGSHRATDTDTGVQLPGPFRSPSVCQDGFFFLMTHKGKKGPAPGSVRNRRTDGQTGALFLAVLPQAFTKQWVSDLDFCGEHRTCHLFSDQEIPLACYKTTCQFSLCLKEGLPTVPIKRPR